MNSNTFDTGEKAVGMLKKDAWNLRKAIKRNDSDALARILAAGWSGPELPAYGQILDLVSREYGYAHFHQFRATHLKPKSDAS